jgi:hypothetical protein
MGKDKISMLVRFLYDNSINTSSRKLNKPKDDDNISDNLSISLVNLGIDVFKKQYFIRTQFLGSGKFYEYHIRYDQFDKWYEAIKEIGKPDNQLDFFDDSKPSIW